MLQSFLDSISGFKDKRGEQADLFADNAAHLIIVLRLRSATDWSLIGAHPIAGLQWIAERMIFNVPSNMAYATAIIKRVCGANNFQIE